jgi:hypothetical protein
MIKIILGAICLVLSILYLVNLHKRSKFNESNIWDKSMIIRGYIGGFCGILLGIALICDALHLY